MIDLSELGALDLDAEEEARALQEMVWVMPQYLRADFNRAGGALLKYYESDFDDRDFIEVWEAYEAALPTINNWRSSHSFPLNTFRMNLGRTAQRIDKECLIAQRIKRLSSIALKLQRFPTMQLTQMQDIGGCRAVLDSITKVNALVKEYEQSEIKHKLDHVDDYIAAPQRSGYRGVHLVYRYYSDRKETYNNLKVEMQLRSPPQHSWATSVETVGTFVQQALKSSIGDRDWLRFFALMGTVVAFRENTAPVPKTYSTMSELLPELLDLSDKLDVTNRLRTYGHALHILEEPSAEAEGAFYYLLKIEPGARQVTVKGFKRNQLEAAQNEYVEIEKSTSKQNADAVLVSVASVASLRRAYPNYFADTEVFTKMVDEAVSKSPRAESAQVRAYPEFLKYAL